MTATDGNGNSGQRMPNRKALGDQYDHLIQTVRGTGYRFSTRAA